MPCFVLGSNGEIENVPPKSRFTIHELVIVNLVASKILVVIYDCLNKQDRNFNSFILKIN